MKYIGVDLSLTGTGIVCLDDDGNLIKQELIKTSSKQSTEERILEISYKIKEFCKEYDRLCTFFIEGLSFGSRGQKMLELAALHYFIRIEVYASPCKYHVVPPTQVKKYITGKGNCEKNLMLLKAYKKWNIEFDDNNVCDAFCIAKYGYEVIMNGDTK